ncbi:MAG: 4Fe-4S dicluster domain-containing protein [Elusimicrobiota bacterium]
MLAIDLDKCFDCKKCKDTAPGIYSYVEKGIRELVCRHCENPPCVAACPVDALEKKEGENLVRYKMLCVSCKQCSSACPVGANPPAVLSYRTYPGHKVDIKKCYKDAVTEIDQVTDEWTVIEEKFAVKAKDWK